MSAWACASFIVLETASAHWEGFSSRRAAPAKAGVAPWSGTSIDTLQLSNGADAVLNGRGLPGNLLAIESNGGQVGTALVGEDGRWQLAIPSPKGEIHLRLAALGPGGQSHPVAPEVRLSLPSSLATWPSQSAIELHSGLEHRQLPRSTRASSFDWSLSERAEALARQASSFFSEYLVAKSRPHVVLAQAGPLRGAPRDDTATDNESGTAYRWWLNRASDDMSYVLRRLSERDPAAPLSAEDRKTTPIVTRPRQAGDPMAGDGVGKWWSLFGTDWLERAGEDYRTVVRRLSAPEGEWNPVADAARRARTEESERAGRRAEEDRVARERERARLAEEAERRRAAELAAEEERRRRLEAERRAAEARAEQERLEREEAQRQAEERARLAREEAERERIAREEAERQRLAEEQRLSEERRRQAEDEAEERRRADAAQREAETLRAEQERRANEARTRLDESYRRLVADAEEDARRARTAAEQAQSLRRKAEEERRLAEKRRDTERRRAAEAERALRAARAASDRARTEAAAREAAERRRQVEAALRDAEEARDAAQARQSAARAAATAADRARRAADRARTAVAQWSAVSDDRRRRAAEERVETERKKAADETAEAERLARLELTRNSGANRAAQVLEGKPGPREDTRIAEGSAERAPGEAQPNTFERRTAYRQTRTRPAATSSARKAVRAAGCRGAGRLVSPLPGVYVVRRGDTLWAIARRHYRRGIHYRVIYRSNRRKIRNPHWIYPCQRFTLPVLRRAR